MPEKIYVLGGGGHGHVVLDALLSSGVAVAGVIDPALSPDLQVFGVPVLGGNEYLDGLVPADVGLVNGIGANPNTRPRADLYESLCSKGFVFESIRHHAATIGRDCVLDRGSQVMAGAVLQAGVTVEQNVVVNTCGSVDHDCILGAHSFVGPGAVLCGKVIVGRNAFVGAGAVVSAGIQIGADAIIGAGAVVVSDVPESSTLVGNPARQIGIDRDE